MSASNRANHVYLVMDGGSPVAAFAHKHAKRTYLRRRYGTFNSPLVYTFGGEQGYTPAIMTMSAAPADGRAVFGWGVRQSATLSVTNTFEMQILEIVDEIAAI
jgi:hypothetical protein